MHASVAHKMSIQVGLYGLSFYLWQSGKEIFLEIPYEAETAVALSGILDKIYTEQLKSLQINQLVLFHHNALNTLVPENWLDAGQAPDLLKFSVKLYPTDTIEIDSGLPSQTANVYVPFENVNNFFIEHYGEIEFYHSATPFLKYARKIHDPAQTEIFVRPMERDFQTVVFRKGELIFFNTFPMENTDDFLYYFFFVWEELELTPLRPGIHILSSGTEHKVLEENLKTFHNPVYYNALAGKEILKFPV